MMNKKGFLFNWKILIFLIAYFVLSFFVSVFAVGCGWSPSDSWFCSDNNFILKIFEPGAWVINQIFFGGGF